MSPLDRTKSPVIQISFNPFLTSSHTKLRDFPLAKNSCVNEALLSGGKLRDKMQNRIIGCFLNKLLKE